MPDELRGKVEVVRPFACHRGIAAPLLRDNVDTDAIIPSREMRRVSKRGLGAGLFANWRYADVGGRLPNPRFVLNQPAYAGASILLGGHNFGCGSSREHAVWALSDFGIRAIFAPSFGAIFRKNCIANGLLPGTVPAADLSTLAGWVAAAPQQNLLAIDLHAGKVSTAKAELAFGIRPGDRQRLLRGLDPIAHTLTATASIDAFERARFDACPWAKLN